ncbi:hypothetical protein [Alloalcanivorax mobilis]|uniref:hypothetical protein n=1 Tax=Alloalcanivorax mobilis TaxID=2019569 RepID=UPI000C76F939|nr:hypothetical protein [Alloalcanivorax mobilis]
MTGNRAITYSLFAVIALGLTACSSAPDKPARGAVHTAAPDSPSHRLEALINRVWTVRASNAVTTGTLYVFLEDGTLVITSSYSEPALGQWQLQDGQLILVEQGIRYQADVLAVDRNELRLVVHSPGEPVRMTLTAAGETRVH